MNNVDINSDTSDRCDSGGSMDRLEIERIEVIKRDYPKGTRVILIRMDDEQAPEKGTEGTVDYVDDIGTVHISWDGGSKLGAVIGVDVIKRQDESVDKMCINPFCI